MFSTMVGGGWRLAVGGWRRLAVGSWQLAVGGGWRRLVVGDWWLVVVGSGWHLAVGRRWRLAAGGWWMAVGGWRLVAVGGGVAWCVRIFLLPIFVIMAESHAVSNCHKKMPGRRKEHDTGTNTLVAKWRCWPASLFHHCKQSSANADKMVEIILKVQADLVVQDFLDAAMATLLSEG